MTNRKSIQEKLCPHFETYMKTMEPDLKELVMKPTQKRLKIIRKKLREQELNLLTNNHDVVDDLDLYDDNNNNKQSTSRQENQSSSATTSMTTSNTNTNTNSLSNSNVVSGSSSTAESTVTSPTRSHSIGSISDMADEHMQF
eukprot:543969_1